MRAALPVLALLLLLPCAAALRAADPGTSSFSLQNGLTVVVVEDHRAPVVTQMVWYRVGARDDPPGRSGTAHFLEHLMFKATGSLADGDFSRIVAENGGSENAFTSLDQTAYFERLAADRLELVMAMEADRMVNLAPSAPSVLSERDVVAEERRQVVEGDPGGRFAEEARAALYAGGAGGRPVIGSEPEIARLTGADALDFYRTHYAPNNAVLVVAGDVRPEAVRRMAERHFGPLPAAPPAARRPAERQPPREAAGRIEVRDPRVSEPQVTRLYLAPPRRAGDQATAAALVVLTDLIGGPRTTALMSRVLVAGDGIALDAGAQYSDTGLDSQSLALSVVPKPGLGAAEAEAALDRLIADFLAEGPDPAEVERIKRRIAAGRIYLQDDVWGRANEVGVALTSGLTLADVEAWPDTLQAVTPDAVAEAARQVLRIENSVTGWLLPPAGAPE